MTINAINDEKKDYVKLKVGAGASRGSMAIMEVVPYDSDGKPLTHKYINVADLKARGVVKRSNSFGKAEAWLNTKEGMKFFDEAEHCQIF